MQNSDEHSVKMYETFFTLTVDKQAIEQIFINRLRWISLGQGSE
jgi:hypothetical protein